MPYFTGHTQYPIPNAIFYCPCCILLTIPQLTKPEADEAFLGNVQDTLLIQVSVLGSNLVPEPASHFKQVEPYSKISFFLLFLSIKVKESVWLIHYKYTWIILTLEHPRYWEKQKYHWPPSQHPHQSCPQTWNQLASVSKVDISFKKFYLLPVGEW